MTDQEAIGMLHLDWRFLRAFHYEIVAQKPSIILAGATKKVESGIKGQDFRIKTFLLLIPFMSADEK